VRKLVKFVLWTAGIVAILLVIARFAGLRFWTVPKDPFLSAAVAPTLAGGDVVIVLTTGTRGFGDLVRCPDPEDPQRWVVGRIYGLAGDKVSVLGTPVVNGKRYGTMDSCTESTAEYPDPKSGAKQVIHCSRVEMAGGWHKVGLGQGTVDTTEEKVVGAGRFFLLSDNRVDHDDSRDFGSVMADTCSDRILFRLWGDAGLADSKTRFEYIR
jgi:signal peptidase I